MVVMKKQRTNSIRKHALISCAAAALALSSASLAQSAETHDIDIAPQDLGSALMEFGTQTGNEVLFVDADVAGKVTKGVEGAYTKDNAIELLLNDSGVKYRQNIDGTLLVGQAVIQQASLGEESNPEPFRVAQLDQGDDVREIALNREDEERVEDTIVVTGTSIRGVIPESSPLDVYTQSDIRNLGATNPRELLARLPQNLSSSVDFGGDEIFRQPNRNQINSPDLRGLGQGSTLVLLNGRRLPLSNSGSAVDVSTIPVAAIERVEVLSDGASSIYGTDAVGGVVNFILKEELDGAVTTLTGSTVTDGGYRSGEINQLLGTSWGSGNVLASLTVSSAAPLEGKDRDFVTLLPRYLSPVDQGYHAFVSGRQDVNNQLSIYGDFLYSSRDVKSLYRQISDTNTIVNNDEIEQVFATIGADYVLSEHLTFELVASYGSTENESLLTRFDDNGTITEDIFDEPYESLELISKLDGRLFEFAGKEVLFAFGGGHFAEELKSVRQFGGATTGSDVELDRETNYVFGELQIPLINAEDSFPLVDRMEINISGRYTDTSDAGDSFDPKIGLVWAFSDALKMRGTYGTSFRAPRLNEIAPSDASVLVLPVDLFGISNPDPFSDDRSTVYFLQTFPSNPNLEPESAESFTVGFDFKPEFVPGLSVSTTYFNIDYSDRIDVPTADVFRALANPDLFADVIRSATLDELGATLANATTLFDLSGNNLSLMSTPQEVNAAVTQIYDLSIANISSLSTDGLDFSVDYQNSIGVGELSLGGAVTYLLSNDQKLTNSSPVDDRLDLITNPVDFRLRAYAGIANGNWSGRLNLNYVDSYENIPESGQTAIDSWTTIDLVSNYTFPADGGSFLSGTDVRVTVQNVFDEDPPFAANAFSGVTNPIGFDPANANPFGRILSVQLVRTW